MIWRALPLCIVLAALPPQALAAAAVEGLAVRIDDGTPLYRETHHIGPQDHRIDYVAIDGTPIGSNRLDYACSDSAPDFLQVDLRAGQREAGRWEDGRYVLETARADGTRRRAESLPPTAGEALPLVASSGFDRFLRGHRARLLAGETLVFRFAMPARLSTLDLRARHEGPRGDGLEWYAIEPEQALLRAFVSPIRVAYDAAGRLAVYRGLSNLVDADGSTQQVEIRYAHRDGSRQDLAIAEPQPAPARIPPRPQCSVEST